MTGRCHYAGLTVRGTGPDITAIRLSEEAPLLTNRHLSVLDYENNGSVANIGLRARFISS